jgi:hypothetical protein
LVAHGVGPGHVDRCGLVFWYVSIRIGIVIGFFGLAAIILGE